MRVPVLSWFFLLAGLLLPAACLQAAVSADSFAEGAIALRENRPGAALEHFLLFVAQSPDDPRVGDALRQAWQAAQTVRDEETRIAAEALNWQEAVALAETKLSERRREAKRTLSELESLARRLPKSRHPLNALRESDVNPDRWSASSLDEFSRLEAERYVGMIRAALQTIAASESPDPAELHEVKGYLWIYSGDWELALSEWKKAAAIRPDERLAARLQWAGERLAADKRKDDAKHEFLLAMGDHKAGRYGDALGHFEKSRALLPDSETERWIGIARAALNEAARQEKIQKLMIAGREEHEAGRVLEAIQSWLDLLALEPSHEEARASLAKARRRLSVVMEERSAVPAAVAAVPAGSSVARVPTEADRARAQAAYSLGLIHYADRNLDAARRAFEDAMTLQPDFPKAEQALKMVRGELNAAGGR